jgi:hypothetical protein
MRYHGAMSYELKRHPDSRSREVAKITVNAARGGAGGLILSYVVSGALAGINLPKPLSPVRTDELWKTTCFEAFVRGPDGEPYCEFNFAPTTQWAAFCFSSYRQGMSLITQIAAPAIDVHLETQFELTAVLDLSRVAGLPADRLWRVGLSAVIEDVDGKSYWALAHPQGKPDFHHADGFVLGLPAGTR